MVYIQARAIFTTCLPTNNPQGKNHHGYVSKGKIEPNRKLFPNHVKHSKKFSRASGVHLKNIRSLDYMGKIVHCKEAHFVLKHLSIQINQGRQLLYMQQHSRPQGHNQNVGIIFTAALSGTLIRALLTTYHPFFVVSTGGCWFMNHSDPFFLSFFLSLATRKASKNCEGRSRQVNNRGNLGRVAGWLAGQLEK